MRVAEVMLRDVALLALDDSVQDAAQAMADTDADIVLVGEDERVDGVFTLRDVLIRIVLKGLDPTVTPLREVMSTDLFTCRDDEDAGVVSRRMAAHRVHHMPVVDAAGRLVGLVADRSADLRATVEAER